MMTVFAYMYILGTGILAGHLLRYLIEGPTFPSKSFINVLILHIIFYVLLISIVYEYVFLRKMGNID